MARLRDMLLIKMYCPIFILCYNLGMIEHLRTGSIVKVIPTGCKESYYIVRVTETTAILPRKALWGFTKHIVWVNFWNLPLVAILRQIGLVLSWKLQVLLRFYLTNEYRQSKAC